MELYYYPLSRYCQKVLLAIYEKQVHFEPKFIDLRNPTERESFLAEFPMGKLPIFKCHDGQYLPEATIIAEYLDRYTKTGTQLLSHHRKKKLNIRLLDRLIDNELNDRLFNIDTIKEACSPLPNHLEIRRQEHQIYCLLEKLNHELAKHHWLCGDSFTLADCAFIPCLRHPWMRKKLKFYENIHRYNQQADTRGAWMLVKDEIILAEAESYLSLNQIP